MEMYENLWKSMEIYENKHFITKPCAKIPVQQQIRATNAPGVQPSEQVGGFLGSKKVDVLAPKMEIFHQNKC